MLLDKFISDIKNGSLQNISSLKDEVNAALLGAEKEKVQPLLDNLIEYCKKKIEEQDCTFMFIYAHLLHSKIGVGLDLKQAIAYYEEAIKVGNAYAMNNRAYMHQYGEGGPVNVVEAIRLYEEAINLGNSLAMNNRATMHEDGKGGPMNFAKAICLYEQAINLGNAYAMNNRAQMHEMGKGGPVNFAKAICLYELAINLGDSYAMNNRADMHERGKGGPVDMISAVRLYRRAADRGDEASIDKLKNTKHPLFQYHFLMHKKDVQGLMAFNFQAESMREFIDFDCAYFVMHQRESIAFIKSLTERYRLQCQSKAKAAELYISILIVLDACTTLNQYHSKELLHLKRYYLEQLNMGIIKEDQVLALIEITINTWYAFSDENEEAMGFTKTAAHLLKTALHRLIACGNEKSCEDFLINIALIIGKDKYGKNYRVLEEQWELSLEQALEPSLNPANLSLVANQGRPQNPTKSRSNIHLSNLFLNTATVDKLEYFRKLSYASIEEAEKMFQSRCIKINDKLPVTQETLFTYLTQKNNLEILRFLLSSKPSKEILNTANAKGASPLSCALLVNNIPLAELLLKSGADINAACTITDKFSITTSGVTALHTIVANASMDKDTEIKTVAFLISQGADINALSKKTVPFDLSQEIGPFFKKARKSLEETALDIARRLGKKEIAHWLKNHGAKTAYHCSTKKHGAVHCNLF